FSQEVMADVLGLSVPHLNRVMQQLRAERLITSRARLVELTDMASLQMLAHYQPLTPSPIPMPAAGAPARGLADHVRATVRSARLALGAAVGPGSAVVPSGVAARNNVASVSATSRSRIAATGRMSLIPPALWPAVSSVSVSRPALRLAKIWSRKRSRLRCASSRFAFH